MYSPARSSVNVRNIHNPDELKLFEDAQAMRQRNTYHRRFCKELVTDRDKANDMKLKHNKYMRFNASLDPLMNDQWGKTLLARMHPDKVVDEEKKQRAAHAALYGKAVSEDDPLKLPKASEHTKELLEMKYTLFPELRPKKKTDAVVANLKDDLFSVLQGHKINADTGGAMSYYKPKDQLSKVELMCYQFTYALMRAMRDKPGEFALEDIFQLMDLNKNGDVSFAEFESFCNDSPCKDCLDRIPSRHWSTKDVFRHLEAGKNPRGVIVIKKFRDGLQNYVYAIHEEQKLDAQAEAIKSMGIDMTDKDAMKAQAQKLLDQQHKTNLITDLDGENNGLRSMFKSSQKHVDDDKERRIALNGEEAGSEAPPSSTDFTKKPAAAVAEIPLMRDTGESWRSIASEKSDKDPLDSAPGTKMVFFNAKAMQKDKDGEDGKKGASLPKIRLKEVADVVIQKNQDKELTREEKEAQKKQMQFEFLENMYEKMLTQRTTTDQDTKMLEAAQNGQRCLHGPSRYMQIPLSCKLHELDKDFDQVQKLMWKLDPMAMVVKQSREKAMKLRNRGGTLIYNEDETDRLRQEMGILNKRLGEIAEKESRHKDRQGLDIGEYREKFAHITVYHDREEWNPHLLVVQTKEQGSTRDITRNWWRKMCADIQRKFASGLTIKYLHDAQTLERVSCVENLRDGGVYVAGGYDENLHVKRQHPHFINRIPEHVRKYHKKPKTPTIKRRPPPPVILTKDSASAENMVSLNAVLDEIFKTQIMTKIKRHGDKQKVAVNRYKDLFATRKDREAEAKAKVQPLLDDLMLPPVSDSDRVLKKMNDHVSSLLGKITEKKTDSANKVTTNLFGDKLSGDKSGASVLSQWMASKKPESIRAPTFEQETVLSVGTPPTNEFEPLARDLSRQFTANVVDEAYYKALPDKPRYPCVETADKRYLGALSNHFMM